MKAVLLDNSGKVANVVVVDGPGDPVVLAWMQDGKTVLFPPPGSAQEQFWTTPPQWGVVATPDEAVPE